MCQLLIWGAGDQGIVTLDCAVAMKRYRNIDFLDFKEKGHREILDHLIYRENDVMVSEFLQSYDEVIVASGDNDLRETKLSLLISMGIPLATIIHPTAVISPSARISKATAILANAVINTNARIGTGCIINTAAVVEHDCVIEDFVNISPMASMAGHTKIGKKSFLGIGCTIIDNIEVGQEAVIGAGAVVIRNVSDHAVMAGVPAKLI